MMMEPLKKAKEQIANLHDMVLKNNNYFNSLTFKSDNFLKTNNWLQLMKCE